MGMFDHVDFKMKCPNCGEMVEGFQSKDGSCTLDILNYWEVDNFYTTCDECGTWIEFVRTNKKMKPISDYVLSITLKGDHQRKLVYDPEEYMVEGDPLQGKSEIVIKEAIKRGWTITLTPPVKADPEDYKGLPRRNKDEDEEGN